MQTLYDVGQTVLVPMTVSKIDINKKSEITYKLECTVLDGKRNETECVVYADESFINSALESKGDENGEEKNDEESEA